MQLNHYNIFCGVWGGSAEPAAAHTKSSEKMAIFFARPPECKDSLASADWRERPRENFKLFALQITPI